MKNLLIIEDEKDQELVRRLFKQRTEDMEAIAKGELQEGTYSTIGDDIGVLDKESRDCIFTDGAVVFDMLKEGDWKVYDFRDGTCYEVGECGLAGLVDELPSHVFPF